MGDSAERILRSVVTVGEDSAWAVRQAEGLRKSQGLLAQKRPGQLGFLGRALSTSDQPPGPLDLMGGRGDTPVKSVRKCESGHTAIFSRFPSVCDGEIDPLPRTTRSSSDDFLRRIDLRRIDDAQPR